MYYDTEARTTDRNNAGLPWNPFKGLVAPRPIGWLSTISKTGVVNVAPYSYFQAVADNPDIVMFSATPAMYEVNGQRHFRTVDRKDSETNALETGEFVCNLVSWSFREIMNLTSANLPKDVDEAAFAGLQMVPSHRVKPSRIAGTPAALECVVVDTHTVRHRGGDHIFRMIFGEVIGIHISDEFIRDGRVDTAAMRLVTRMGYDEFAVLETSFRMPRPDFDLMSNGLLE